MTTRRSVGLASLGVIGLLVGGLALTLRPLRGDPVPYPSEESAEKTRESKVKS